MRNPLWQRLEQALLAYPDSRVEDEQGALTFEELRNRAKSLGAILARRIPPGGCCGVLCKSEKNAGLLLLALVCAGVTAVPLSVRYGKLHCQTILQKVRPCMLLSDDGEASEWVDFNIPIVLLDELYTENWQISSRNDPNLWDVAAVMCTSGTTGEPKGILLTYANIRANLQDIEAYFDLNPDDRILILRPLYHAAVLTGEFLLALTKGASIRFVNGAFSPAGILSQIREGGITALCATPTLLSLLCKTAARRGGLPGLTSVVASGECMTQSVWEELSRSLTKARIYHVYGLTEASPRVAYQISSQSDAPLSAGRPLLSVRLGILREDKTITSSGQGELLVQGPNVMKGYLNDPAATSRALEGGWLHTGDLVRIDSRGRLFLLGRKDHLIIRAGMNIYPQEIENALLRSGAVREAMAYGGPGPEGRQQIVLRVVPNEEDATPGGILAACRRTLPGYQIPDRIELVKTLPKNGSGKLIRPVFRRDTAEPAHDATDAERFETTCRLV